MIETPVLIAGGGPVGMTLALFLAHYGVRAILVERNAATTRHPKMDLTNGRSMELFRRIGLNEALRDAGVPRENAFDISWATSLAGHELQRFRYPSANEQTRIIAAENDGHHACEAPLRVSQIVIEPVLKKAVDANPLIDVRFNTAFEKIVDQDNDGVTVLIKDGATDELSEVRCAYLAGCDGGGSRVRRQLGIELDGDMAVASAYMVHFRSNDRAFLQRWGVAWHMQTPAGSMIAQNDYDTWTLQRWIFPGEDPSTMRPEEILETWAGKKFDYEILQANPWSANFVVAQKYVQGRVVLAGDSAHQYIPTGGYGMNSGVADAAGLSWVLAALVQGWGGEGLLRAYEAERRPTAWFHLAAARRHFETRIQIDAVYRAAGDLDGEGPAADAKRAEVGAQIVALGNAENESWGVEWGYRYDESPIILSEPDAPPVDPLNYRPNTYPGVRIPHVFLEEGVSIQDRLGRYFTLVVFNDTDVKPLVETAARLSIPLDVLTLDRPDLRSIYARDLLLVRPDQHIAWRGNELPAQPDVLLERVIGKKC